MALDRRAFLKGSAGAAIGMSSVVSVSAVSGCVSPSRPYQSEVFRHGVASGDPLADRVVLWTRATPRADSPRSFPVRWIVAEEPDLGDLVASGSVVAGTVRDYTVKVDVDGLEPGRTYYYRFEALGATSTIGRTRTLPGGSPERVRLAFCSCSNIAWGFFNAYALIARRADLDLVLHLGDYLYEHANGTYGDGTAIGRVPEPDREIVSLSDYRTRHAQYKLDPDLQEVHRQHPFVAVWDDHEFANNAWRGGAENHQERDGDWAERRRNALRAYLEWMPIREFGREGAGRGWRRLEFGDLVDLIVLETRLERDIQVADPRDAVQLGRADRTLLGAEQEDWLERQISDSARRRVAWRVLAQQIQMAPLRPDATGAIRNPDAWDGYPVSRERVLSQLERQGLRNNLVLTGDLHSSWAIDLPRDLASYDPKRGRGGIAVEFVAPGISAPGLLDPARAESRAAQVMAEQPHVRWVDFFHRGYALLDVDRERAQCDWYHVETVDRPLVKEEFARAFRSRRGADRLEPVARPSATPSSAPDPAP
jgi:alkaline phosphatase D